MKGLSIEEKAKAYDEAIAKGKQILNTPYTAHWDTMKEVVEHLIPELAESKDDRIIKSINRLISHYYDVNFPTPEGFTREELVSWDEKQSEQKYTKKDIDDAYLKGICDAKQELEKQGEQTPWSEEDEAIYYGVIETEQYMLDVVNGIKKFDVGNTSIKEDCTRELDWLKSLKPQNRQEWNSKDKKIKNKIVNYFTCQCKDEPTRIKTLNRWICWLNTLDNSSVIKPMPEFDEWLKQIWDILDWAEERGRINYSDWCDYTNMLENLNPKNRWKPSDEQLEALDSATENCAYSKYQDCLRELIGQLKKLKG